MTSHLLAQFVQVKQGKTFRNPHEDTLKRPLSTLTLKGPAVTSRGWTRSTLAFPPIGLLAPVRLTKYPPVSITSRSPSSAGARRYLLGVDRNRYHLPHVHQHRCARPSRQHDLCWCSSLRVDVQDPTGG